MLVTHDQAALRRSRQWGPGEGDTSAAIYRYPSSDQSETRVIVSLAQIASTVTSFTKLPGKQRYHLLLTGKTELTVADQSLTLQGNYPCHRFDGGAATTCTLLSDVPARPFNVIHDPDISVLSTGPFTELEQDKWELGKASEMFLRRPGMTWMVDLLFCVSGSAVVNWPVADTPRTLLQHDALIIGRGETEEKDVTVKLLRGEAVMLAIRLLIGRN